MPKADPRKPVPHHKNTLLQRLISRSQANDIQPWTKQSQTWFRDKVKLMASKSTFDSVERDGSRTGRLLERAPGIGFMYTFAYKAKTDKKLPYWDRFL